MKYMHAIGQHERLSLANGLLLVQMFSQADKLRTVSVGMPGVQKKKGYSNLKIENRMPTHRTNIRITEYSGPALLLTLINLERDFFVLFYSDRPIPAD